MRRPLARPVPRARPRFLLSMMACALAVAAAWLALTPPDPSYVLLAVEDDGNVYALDFNLTLRDCRTRQADVRHGYTYCEEG